MGNVEGYDLDHDYAVIKIEADESLYLQRSRSENEWRAFFTATNMKRSIISTLLLEDK